MSVPAPSTPSACQTLTARAALASGVQGKFALDCAVGALDLYDDFFGVEYPLVKLDMIAIPEFAAGAMENWYGHTRESTAPSREASFPCAGLPVGVEFRPM